MYSLALIIFVVSEKKAFEHFPIGFNANLCPAPGMIIGRPSVFYADRKSKMAATTGHSINTGPYREAIALIEPKLCINHWKVLYKLCVFIQ
jgi:hypothetical protein